MIYAIIPGTRFNEFILTETIIGSRAFYETFQEKDVLIKYNTTLIDLENEKVINYFDEKYTVDMRDCFLTDSKREVFIKFFSDENMLLQIFNKG